MEKLSQLREKIDEIDESIVNLLEERASIVLKVKEAKAESNVNIYSPSREVEIRERVQELSKDGNFPKETLDTIFSSIVGATRSLIGKLTIAYFGPPWSRAYQAAFRQFGEDVDFLSCDSVNGVVEACSQGEASYGIVPIETSSGGVFSRTCSALLSKDNDRLNVVAEIKLKQSLAIFSEAASLEAIETLYGDASSFIEAESWLSERLPKVKRELLTESDSLAELLSRERNAAFLGPEEILTEESLTALAKGINSSSGEKVNTSVARFFVLGNTPARETKRDRVSIICGVKEHAGALHEVLKFFAEREINLTKIESKMLNGQLSFFIDIDGSLSSEKISGAVAELGKETVFLKVLGSYPSALEPGRA